MAALCSLYSFNRGFMFRAPFPAYTVLQNQDVKKQEKTLGVAGLPGRRIQGHFAWTLHLVARDRTLPRSLQPEASGPGTGICTLNALEEPGRWPFGGASCDSCFLSQRRGPFGLRRCASRGVHSGSPSPAGKAGHPCSLEPPSQGPSPAPAPLPGPQPPSQHGAPLRVPSASPDHSGRPSGGGPHTRLTFRFQTSEPPAPRPGNPSLPGKGTSPRPPHLLPGSPPLPVRL